MTSETIVGGVTFPSALAIAAPNIPGLVSFGFPGTGFSNNQGNRVAGGPAFVSNGTPVYGTNNVLVGGSSPYNWINTQNPRSAGVAASGFTWVAVARTPGGGLPSIIMGDAVTTTTGVAVHMRANAASALIFGSSNVSIPIVAQLTMTTPATLYHCVALTYDPAGTGNIYDLTDGLSASGAIALTANTDLSPHVGSSGDGEEGSNISNQITLAAWVVAQSLLNSGQLASVHAWLQSICAFRGIAC